MTSQHTQSAIYSLQYIYSLVFTCSRTCRYSLAMALQLHDNPSIFLSLFSLIHGLNPSFLLFLLPSGTDTYIQIILILCKFYYISITYQPYYRIPLSLSRRPPLRFAPELNLFDFISASPAFSYRLTPGLLPQSNILEKIKFLNYPPPRRSRISPRAQKQNNFYHFSYNNNREPFSNLFSYFKQ